MVWHFWKISDDCCAVQGRQEERMEALNILEAELARIKDEKAALEKENIALEQSARLREEQKAYDAQPAGQPLGFDAEYVVSSSFLKCKT